MPILLARKNEGKIKTCPDCGCTFLYSDNEVIVEIITRKDFHGKQKTDRTWYINCPDCGRCCGICPPFNFEKEKEPTIMQEPEFKEAVKKALIETFKEIKENE